jgi:hypothetical protein
MILSLNNNSNKLFLIGFQYIRQCKIFNTGLGGNISEADHI